MIEYTVLLKSGNWKMEDLSIDRYSGPKFALAKFLWPFIFRPDHSILSATEIVGKQSHKIQGNDRPMSDNVFQSCHPLVCILNRSLRSDLKAVGAGGLSRPTPEGPIERALISKAREESDFAQ